MQPSALQKRLENIARTIPGVELHPCSPSGPHVRVILLRTPDRKIRAQIGWDNTSKPARWMVRAFCEDAPEETLLVTHPNTEHELGEAAEHMVATLAATAPILLLVRNLFGRKS